MNAREREFEESRSAFRGLLIGLLMSAIIVGGIALVVCGVMAVIS